VFGMPTQPTQRRDNDAAFGVGAAVGSRPPRPRTPPEKPDDLKKARADHDEDKHGTKMWSALDVSGVKLSPVHNTGNLLTLRAELLSKLSPLILWIGLLSTVEWASLTDDQKTFHAKMRVAFLTQYAFGSAHILAPSQGSHARICPADSRVHKQLRHL